MRSTWSQDIRAACESAEVPYVFEPVASCALPVCRAQDHLGRRQGHGGQPFKIAGVTPVSAFSLIDRQRLKPWQRLFHEQLALVDDLLLPQRTEEKT